VTFVAGVDHQRFARVRIADDRAVCTASIPTGMVMWINPSVVELRAVRPSLIIRSISSELKGFVAPPRAASLPAVSADINAAQAFW